VTSQPVVLLNYYVIYIFYSKTFVLFQRYINQKTDSDVGFNELQSINQQVRDDTMVSQREVDTVNSRRHCDVPAVRLDLDDLQQACKRAMNEVLIMQDATQRIANALPPSGNSELTIENIEQDALLAYIKILQIENQVLSL